MSYLLAFVILSNNMVVTIPTSVFGSLQTCESARVKLTKDLDRKFKDAIIFTSCLDR